MGSGDDRTFRVNFSGDGVSKLKEQVQEKLKEFMGDYTDDTLVEYVIVLLRNGRNKEEAKNELDVFLGDDSDCFVSWLWDHLGTHLNLYIKQESPLDGAIKTRPASVVHAGNDEMHHMKSESDQVKSDKPRSRHKREWKGLLRDADGHLALQSVVVDATKPEVEKKHKFDRRTRSKSPEPEVHRKRNRPEDGLSKKREIRESISQPKIAAPRRLLQFAVRDAVATSRPSNSVNSVAEPSLKRLRSVVSTSMEDSPAEERSHKIRSVARLPNALATAIKAVAEAAEDVKKVRPSEAAQDVKKVRPSANVFDRLGSVTGTLDTKGQLVLSEYIPEDVDEQFVDVTEVPLTNHQRSDSRGRYPGMASDPRLEEQVYEDNSVVGRRAMDASKKHMYVGNRSENPQLVEHIVGNNSDGLMLKSVKDQDHPAATSYAAPKMSGPLNVNTWKSSQYQDASKSLEIGSHINKSTISADTKGAKPGMPVMKENSDLSAFDNGNVKSSAGINVESQKIQSAVPGLNPTGAPTEDSDSRTIFVNNVHFAATKDSLSRHFNKFGKVLKVIILTDAATGQPKGSAYVEFMRKESAENALSLDGTSFMSRIVKVVRKSSAPQPPEPTPSMSWPRVARATPFTASRFPRASFPRGMPGSYRSRLTVKHGARSMQWKRDAQSTSAPTSTSSSSPTVALSSAAPPFTPRSMTYVRAEQKTNGTSSDAA